MDSGPVRPSPGTVAYVLKFVRTYVGTHSRTKVLTESRAYLITWFRTQVLAEGCAYFSSPGWSAIRRRLSRPGRGCRSRCRAGSGGAGAAGRGLRVRRP